MIEDLVKLDEEQAIALFLEKEEKKDKVDVGRYYVPPDVIVAKLEKNPKYQYMVSSLHSRKIVGWFVSILLFCIGKSSLKQFIFSI